MVIYTAIAGGYDDLLHHTYICKDADYICFTDQHIEEAGVWEIRTMDHTEPEPVRRAKYYKLFPHVLFPDYDYSVWIDGNVDLLDNDLERRIRELIGNDTALSANLHFKRTCIYEELETCIQKKKDDIATLIKHREFIKSKNYPVNNGLFEMNIIFRAHHHQGIITVMNDWWRIISQFSRRDQLSFMYVLWENKATCIPLYENSARQRKGFSFHQHNRRFSSGLFYDTGNGFNGKELHFNEFLLSGNKTFQVNFSFDSCIPVQKIKFSPHLRCFSKIILKEVMVTTQTGQQTIDLDTMKTNGMWIGRNCYLFKKYYPYCIAYIGKDICEVRIMGEISLYTSARQVQKFLRKWRKMKLRMLPFSLVKGFIRRMFGRR